MITLYFMVKASQIEDLINRVNERMTNTDPLGDYSEPLGAPLYHDGFFYQVMVTRSRLGGN